jgi:hypothetical protein
LQAWKGHWIPQPATFWTREVWDACGPLDESEPLVLDYDLMCRISRRFRFHVVDRVLAAYRLHGASKSCTNAKEDVAEEAVRVSRRYWGPPRGLRYWRMAASLALHRLEKYSGRRRRAMDWTLKAWAEGDWRRRAIYLARAALLAPEVFLRRFWRLRAAPRWRRLLPAAAATVRSWNGSGFPPAASVWRSFHGVHADGCVGPEYETVVQIAPGARWLHLDGEPILGRLPEPLDVQITLDGGPAVYRRITEPRPFTLTASLVGVPSGPHVVRLTCRPFVMYDDFLGNGDCRPLAFRLRGVRIEVDGADVGKQAA